MTDPMEETLDKNIETIKIAFVDTMKNLRRSGISETLIMSGMLSIAATSIAFFNDAASERKELCDKFAKTVEDIAKLAEAEGE